MNSNFAIGVKNQNVPVDGEMFAIRPSSKAWAEIGRVEKYVTDKLSKEGVQVWEKPSKSKAHFTLFAGINKATYDERVDILYRIVDKIEALNLKILTVNMDAADTKITRGPGHWVSLSFNDKGELEKVHRAVKEALYESKAYRNGKIDQNKLEKNKYFPHITLGICGVDNNPRHPDIVKLNDRGRKRQFEKEFEAQKRPGGKFYNRSFKIDLSKIDLIGIKNLQKKTADREYVELGKVISVEKPKSCV